MIKKVSNFDFLNKLDLMLVRLGTFAETYPKNDPHASLIRLRQYGQILSRHIAKKFHIYVESEVVDFKNSRITLLRTKNDERRILPLVCKANDLIKQLY
jgi:hypothetical protein